MSEVTRKSSVVTARAARASCAVFSGVLMLAAAGCANLSYPKREMVTNAKNTLPQLTTIEDGEAYLAAARDNMTAEREKLINSDMWLGTSILAGFVALADGAVSSWSSRTVGRLGIFSTAMVGVQSALSLKTQYLIINKGLDALNCVKAQAAAAYVPVRQYNSLLGPVFLDISLLEDAITVAKAKYGSNNAHKEWLAKADYSLARGKQWVAATNASVININVGVVVAVDEVIQTTVNQLSSALPDGSAFARIGGSLPTPSAASAGTPPEDKLGTTRSSSPAPGGAREKKKAEGPVEGAEVPPEIEKVKTLNSDLYRDMTDAQAKLTALGPLRAVNQLPSINCNVGAVVQPLSLSALSAPIFNGTASTAWVSVNGGRPPFTSQVTAANSGQKPEEIKADVNNSTVILMASANVPAGAYNLVVTDSEGVQRTLSFMVGSPR